MGKTTKRASRRITSASLRNAFREIIWPRRRLVLAGLGLILVNRLSGLVLPASTTYLVDDVIGAGRGELLFPILGGLLAAVALQAGTSFTLTRLLSVEAQRMIAELRAQVQRHVLRLPVRRFDEVKSGELVSRIMDDVEGVRNLVGTGLVQLVGGTLTAVVALVFLLRIDRGDDGARDRAARAASRPSRRAPSASCGPPSASAAGSAPTSPAA